MDLNALTIGDLKELRGLLGNQAATPTDTGFYDRYIGQYVIVRTRNEGLNCGEVVACDATGVVLKNARRLWRVKTESGQPAWYEGVSQVGLSKDSRISAAADEKAIIEDYSITVCTDIAKQSLETAVSHETA